MNGLFKVLDGKQAGLSVTARRFPFWIGRGLGAGLRLEEPGVWDQHVEVTCDREEGIVARVQSPALARLDGEVFEATVLRSGDMLEIGGVRVQFWLPPVAVVTPWLREGLTWVGVGMVAALEVGLAYWIAR